MRAQPGVPLNASVVKSAIIENWFILSFVSTAAHCLDHCLDREEPVYIKSISERWRITSEVA